MTPRAEWTPAGASADVPDAQLLAGDLRVDHADDHLTISVKLNWFGANHELAATSGERLAITVDALDRLGCDRRHLLAAHSPPNATALVPLLAVIAAAGDADLTIDAPVCPVTLAGARRAVAVGQEVYGWSAVTLGATAGAPSPQPRDGVGLVFSLDLPAVASVVALRRAGQEPTHLIAIEGFSPVVRGRAEAVAANAARLPLVRVATNCDTFLRTQTDRDAAQHAVVTSCSLALAGVIDTAVIPALTSASSAVGYTSGDAADGMWSSHATPLASVIGDLPFVEAAALVTTDPWARQWVTVCASQRAEGNCGRCRPCQLALAALFASGAAPEDWPWFAHPADPAIVGALVPSAIHNPDDYLEVIDALVDVTNGSTGSRAANLTDRQIAAALAQAWADHLAHVGATPGTGAGTAPAISA